MKKAQISSQVFIYILAAVILSITLIFGYKMINTFRINAELSTINDFEFELESTVNELSDEWGSVKRETFSLPGSITHLCMSNSGIHELISSDIVYPDIHPLVLSLIQDSIESKILKNIFLIEENKIKDSFFINNTKIYEFDNENPDNVDDTEIKFTCFENKNNIKLYFIAEGKFVKIMEDIKK
ncbi:hypothetical protein JXB41_04465 [Candidatus Woesearchaeota archaeon]|nr:hypothetical protein [Candidatus Woesearchaeota archaeon]